MPGLTFTLKIDNSAAVLDHLIDHGADVAVMAKMTSDPRIYSMKLREDRLVLFVPRKPSLRRGGGALRLADLAGHDIVVRERGSITREVFETRLAEAGDRAGIADRGADARSGARGGRRRLRHRRGVRQANSERCRASTRSTWPTPI